MRDLAPDAVPSQRRLGAVPTLKKRAEFLKLAKGMRRSASAFSIQALPAAQGNGRFGFTVTKKTGTATERNRMRRRLRAAARLVEADLPSLDVVIVARRACLTSDFSRLSQDLSQQIASVRRRLAGELTSSGG